MPEGLDIVLSPASTSASHKNWPSHVEGKGVDTACTDRETQTKAMKGDTHHPILTTHFNSAHHHDPLPPPPERRGSVSGH